MISSVCMVSLKNLVRHLCIYILKSFHEALLGVVSLRAPFKYCTRPECQNHSLGDPRITEARLFTLRRGILPIFPVSVYCRGMSIYTSQIRGLPTPLQSGCHTRYYPCYSVKDAVNDNSERIFYPGPIPDIIHVTESCFVERELIIFFETQMSVQL